MEFQITFVIFAVFSILRGFRCGIVEGPSDVTALYGANDQLICKTEVNDVPGWTEIIPGNEVPIFRGYVKEAKQEKYINFNISGTTPDYNLQVKSIEIEDEGVYECAVTLADGVMATLSVEAPAENITLTCDAQSIDCPVPGEEATPDVRCTCTATGAYPDTLHFDWTGIESPTTSPIITPTANGRKNSFDYEQEASGSISSTSGSIKCTLTSYTLTEAERSATFNYSSPVCELSVEYDETCTGETANLTCTCSGGNPKVNKYTFFDEDSNTIGGDTNINVRLNVPINSDKETTFYCRGCNGFNVGDQSLSTMTICESGTTILPSTTSEPRPTPSTSIAFTTNSTTNDAQPTGSTTTTKKDNGTGTENGDNNPPVVVIVVIVIVVIIILITVGGFIYWMVFKRGCCEKCTEEKNSDANSLSSVGPPNNNAKDFDLSGTPQINAVTATTGDTSSAPVYGVIDKSKKKKSDKTDGNGMPMSEAPEYAAVDKPLKSEPKPAPRSSQLPPNNSTEKQELQYADIDHSNRTPSNQIRQPAEAPTEYATVQSVIV